MLKLIIFDLDGTLLDTLADLNGSVNFALGQFGMPARTPLETRAALGNGIKRLIQLSVPSGTDENTTENVLGVFRNHYEIHCLDKTKPYKGVIALLQELKARGVKTAIVSNKIDTAVKELHKRFFSDTIDFAIGETLQIRRKPAPDMIEECLKEMNVTDKNKALYVGDSEVDINTASNCGIECCSVSWGFRDKEQLVESGATTIVDSPEEILSKYFSD